MMTVSEWCSYGTLLAAPLSLDWNCCQMITKALVWRGGESENGMWALVMDDVDRLDIEQSHFHSDSQPASHRRVYLISPSCLPLPRPQTPWEPVPPSGHRRGGGERCASFGISRYQPLPLLCGVTRGGRLLVTLHPWSSWSSSALVSSGHVAAN